MNTQHFKHIAQWVGASTLALLALGANATTFHAAITLDAQANCMEVGGGAGGKPVYLPLQAGTYKVTVKSSTVKTCPGMGTFCVAQNTASVMLDGMGQPMVYGLRLEGAGVVSPGSTQPPAALVFNVEAGQAGFYASLPSSVCYDTQGNLNPDLSGTMVLKIAKTK